MIWEGGLGEEDPRVCMLGSCLCIQAPSAYLSRQQGNSNIKHLHVYLEREEKRGGGVLDKSTMQEFFCP